MESLLPNSNTYTKRESHTTIRETDKGCRKKEERTPTVKKREIYGIVKERERHRET